jgi:hypothetical protein
MQLQLTTQNAEGTTIVLGRKSSEKPYRCLAQLTDHLKLIPMCDDAVEHETEIKIFLEEQGML